MSNEVEMTKTVYGSDVRIYARNVGPLNAIHGAYENGGFWHIVEWQQSGLYRVVDEGISRCGLDLIESLGFYPEEDEPTVA